MPPETPGPADVGRRRRDRCPSTGRARFDHAARRMHRAVDGAIERAAARGDRGRPARPRGRCGSASPTGTPVEDLDDDTAAAIAAVDSAKAVIFATPVYRGSLTGSLKNLFDLMPVPALQGKVVGLVAMGASDHHYLGAERHLRDVLAFFGALPLPVAVYLNGGDFEDGVPGERAETVLDQLFTGVAATAAALDRSRRSPSRPRWRPGRSNRGRGRRADADRRDADRRTRAADADTRVRRGRRAPTESPLAAVPPIDDAADALPNASVRAIVIDAPRALADRPSRRCSRSSRDRTLPCSPPTAPNRSRSPVATGPTWRSSTSPRRGPFAGSITAAIREAHPGVQILLTSRCRTTPRGAAGQPRRDRLPPRRRPPARK